MRPKRLPYNSCAAFEAFLSSRDPGGFEFNIAPRKSWMMSAAAIAVMSAIKKIQYDVRMKSRTITYRLKKLRRTVIIRGRDFD